MSECSGPGCEHHSHTEIPGIVVKQFIPKTQAQLRMKPQTADQHRIQRNRYKAKRRKGIPGY